MVFGIVQQSGGCIHVDSAPGAGATFRIYLPSVSEPAARPAGEAAVAGSTGAETILVVEDDTMLRTLAVRALEARGYRVIAASNGEEALKLGQLSDEPVALVLTDVVMPKMSGPELVKRLADRLPGAKVLYMSGYTDDAIVRHGLMDASVALIPKPFTPLGLAQKVREILDRDKKAAGAGR
jgi:DNA-binding response OmpR family regulator